jgi:hypothetical protein
MPTYILALPASEVVRLLRAETRTAFGQPELDVCSEKEYVIEEDFDRSAYGIHDGENFDLVSSVAALNIEPRVERDYWVLKVVVERLLGPLEIEAEDAFAPSELTLDAFEKELWTAGRKRITVRLEAETAKAKRHFDRWLADMGARHPPEPRVRQPHDEIAHLAHTRSEQSDMTDDLGKTTKWAYDAREAVGVFRDAAVLEEAVDQLETSGFDRSAISVLATGAGARERTERFYRTVSDIEDRADAPQGAFVSVDSRTEGETAVIGIPFYIGGAAGAFAVVATGGALAPAFAAAIAGGAIGAGLGALLAAAVARHHAARIQQQLKKGGIVLWVNTPNVDAEKRAVAVLERLGAEHVHVHQVQREWSVRDVPLATVQPDPFLEPDG